METRTDVDAAPVHAVVMPQLEWDCTDEIRLDDSIVFGLGYDFFGLESLRREARGPNGSYLIWPNNGKWSLYRETDGMLAFEKYSSREECEQTAERWCAAAQENDPSIGIQFPDHHNLQV